METTKSDDRGVVCKKTTGGYQVHAGRRVLSCVLAKNLYRQLIYQEANPRSHRLAAEKIRSTKHIDPVAVGDQVRIMDGGDGSGQIIEILPRRNKLSRPATGPGLDIFEQVIAANVDQVVPVFSTASPIPKWGLLDRYLVVAEVSGLPAQICITKIDLVRPDESMSQMLNEYQKIGYPVHLVSTKSGEGLETFQQNLKGCVSVLVGKSGVGKTSILNVLQPGLENRTQEVTAGYKGKGRHTTTSLEMINLRSGGALIDTPGIREYGLWDIYPEELTWCFPEMRPFEGLCRFGMDCRHDSEPGCAIRKAVMSGAISPYRYKSYMRLYEELQ